MKASPADQRRLLDLADLDARIIRADAARKNPPQAARVSELIARRQELTQELTTRLGGRDDLQTELKRIESDVALVDARRTRDADRLAASSNSKEAQGLESELASLARRKSDLEDAELDVMDRLEQAEASVSEQESLISEINAEGARLSAEGKQAVADATATFEQASRDRASIAGAIAADLLALYDRIGKRTTAAGLLRRNTCEACNMVLSGTDLQAIRQAESDDIANCPECGAILVRTEESGL